MNQEKFYRLFHLYSKNTRSGDAYGEMCLGICNIILGNFTKASGWFNKALLDSLNPKAIWRTASCPHWLVDIWVLSGNRSINHKVETELMAYKKDRKGDSLVSNYSYAIFNVITKNQVDNKEYINKLLRYPKEKLFYSIGMALSCLMEKNEKELELSFTQILRAHDGCARFGELKASAEGFLCLPANSIYLATIENQLSIDFKNGYLADKYMAYIKDQT